MRPGAHLVAHLQLVGAVGLEVRRVARLARVVQRSPAIVLAVRHGLLEPAHHVRRGAAALARREVFLLESEHIAAKPIPVEVHVRAIHQRIRTAKHLRFSQLVGPGTPKDVAVVTFLAILELYKRVMVRLEQDELFGDIAIDYIEGSGDLRLEGDDALTSVGEE